LKTALPVLLASKAAVAIAAIEALTALDLKDESASLHALMTRTDAPAKVRGVALATLAKFNDPQLDDAIKLALMDRDPALRVEASALLGKLDPDEAAAQLAGAFADAAIAEKKVVITALGDLRTPAADKALSTLIDEFAAGKVPDEVQLELLEAAAKRTAPETKAKLAGYFANVPKSDPIAPFASALAGGDKDEGERLFKEHAIAACLRCHKVNGTGGEAGPDLTGIGSKRDRRYILESLIAPNAQIAEGFQTVLITMNDGELQAGVVKGENDRELVLQLGDAAPVTLPKADIKSRENAPSGMLPNLGELLTKREIRDLVEYVASLKAP
jgi:quinoprotein glucose dehydrogenase